MTSFIYELWAKSIGRGRFALIFAVIGGLVFFLSGTINFGLGVAFKGAGPDPAFAILGGLLFGWLSGLGLLALFTALVIATRMRLRDLELSGALTLLFPLLALPPLVTFIYLRMQPLLLVAGGAHSPLLSAAVLTDVLLGAALSITPGRLAGRPLRGKVIENLREWTDCEAKIDLAGFRSRAGGAIALLLFGDFFDRSGLIAALSATVLLSLCVRRLHHLGKTCLMAGLIPLTNPSGVALLVLAMTPLGLVPGLNLLIAFFPIALYVATLVFLIYLFEGGPRNGPARVAPLADI